jgi:hypothetical protein
LILIVKGIVILKGKFNKMLVKIHPSYRSTVAICDSGLIGKTFEEGNKQIILNPHFYQGEEKTEKEVLEILENGSAEDFTFNIVGEESTSLALKAGLIRQEGITRIQGVPIALVLL